MEIRRKLKIIKCGPTETRPSETRPWTIFAFVIGIKPKGIYLRYKLVSLQVQKALNFFTGSAKAPSDDIETCPRNRDWSDVARIVDKTSVS